MPLDFALSPHCKFSPLTDTLDNQHGSRAGQCENNSLYALNLPPPGLELTPAPLALTKPHSHWSRPCICPHAQTSGGRFTRAIYESVSVSLSLMRTLIRGPGRGSVADKPRTSRCPSLSVARLQVLANEPGNCQWTRQIANEPGRTCQWTRRDFGPLVFFIIRTGLGHWPTG